MAKPLSSVLTVAPVLILLAANLVLLLLPDQLARVQRVIGIGQDREEQKLWQAFPGEPARAALIRRLESEGGFIHAHIANREVVSQGGLVRTNGFVAAANISNGTVLFAAPIKTHLTPTYALRESRLARNVQPFATLQHTSFAMWLATEKNNPKSRIAAELEYYDDIDYEYMIYFQPEEKQKLFKPSPEYVYGEFGVGWYKTQFEKVLHNFHRECHPGTEGWCDPIGNISLKDFMWANLLISTRSYSSSHDFSLVPVGDGFNHANPGIRNCYWEFDGSKHMLEITAERDIAEGEEILISYGSLANPLLFTSYGFTIPPHQEPCCSFRIWSHVFASQFAHVKYEWPADQVEAHLAVDSFDAPIRGILNAGAKLSTYKTVPAFLQTFTRHFIKKYEADELIAPYIQQLAHNRKKNRRSRVWWAACDWDKENIEFECGDEDRSIESGDLWTAQAIRVKMSEYTALRVNEDAANVLLGEASADRVIEEAKAQVENIKFHINWDETVAELDSATATATDAGSENENEDVAADAETDDLS